MACCQAVCLIIGMWLQDRFVLSLARWNSAHPGSTQELQCADHGTRADPSETTINESFAYDGEKLRTAMLQAGPLSFVWIFGLQTIVAYLLITRLYVEHTQKEEQSHEILARRAKELVRTRDAVIFGLAKLAESRDPDTGHHLERIALYSTRLAAALRRQSSYRKVITPRFVQMIGVSSALHDIGKVGIPDKVLFKPAGLSSSERQHMESHAELGGECIRQIEMRIGTSNFLSMACEIAYHHHERWDGSGYPAGLEGEAIPLTARIVAIADVYDALVSRRVYKDAFSHEECVNMIRGEAGKHFDPELVRVFLSIEDQFRAISDRFREESPLNDDRPRMTYEQIDLQQFDPEEKKILETVRTIYAEFSQISESHSNVPSATELETLFEHN